MGTISVEQAVQSLYDQLVGTEYKPSAYWTVTNNFKPAYQKIDSEFILDTTLVPPKGIEPLSPRS